MWIEYQTALGSVMEIYHWKGGKDYGNGKNAGHFLLNDFRSFFSFKTPGSFVKG